MLDQFENNDKYFLKNHFTTNVTIITTKNYKKFHDKINRVSLTRKQLKKLIFKKYHDYVKC